MSLNVRISVLLFLGGVGTCAGVSAAPPATAATAASTAATSRHARCNTLFIQYWNGQEIRFVYGSLETKADADKRTTQIVIVDGLATAQSKIKDEGQIIYTSRSAVSDGPTLARLADKAIVARIAADTSLDCHSEAGL